MRLAISEGHLLDNDLLGKGAAADHGRRGQAVAALPGHSEVKWCGVAAKGRVARRAAFTCCGVRRCRLRCRRRPALRARARP